MLGCTKAVSNLQKEIQGTTNNNNKHNSDENIKSNNNKYSNNSLWLQQKYNMP